MSPILFKATTLKCPSYTAGVGHRVRPRGWLDTCPQLGGCRHCNNTLTSRCSPRHHTQDRPCGRTVDRWGNGPVAAPQTAGKCGPEIILPLAGSSWLTVPGSAQNTPTQERLPRTDQGSGR